MDELDVLQEMKIKTLLYLCFLASSTFVNGATVFLVAEGTIDRTLVDAFPLVQAGDAFRLTVSYSGDFADTDADPDLGVYLPSDLSIFFEVIGKGVVFESIGGSVNVLGRGADFPVYNIISQTQPNGHSLFLIFNDRDRSHSPLIGDKLPFDFGNFEDYDSIVFSIINIPAVDMQTTLPIPGTIPPNLVDGTVTSLSVPEPTTTSIFGIALTLLIATRRRRIEEVEQAETQ